MRIYPSSIAFRIITHNVRYAASSRARGEDPWEVRRGHLISELRFNSLYCPETFICLQEVLHRQLLDIHHGLDHDGPQWEYIGVGRDDGKEAGEYSPIFYRPAIWKLLEHKSVWLSETPDRPSKGWDAASTRILTIGVFRHVESRRTVVAMSTHLDDQGAQARTEAAKIILQQVERYSCHGPDACPDEHGTSPWLPVFVAGDFNSPPDDGAYKTITGSNPGMSSLQSLVPSGNTYGHDKTFSGFDDWDKPMTKLDYIFVNERSPDRVTPWSPTMYAVLENRFDDRVYLSDHRAVVGDVVLK